MFPLYSESHFSADSACNTALSGYYHRIYELHDIDKSSLFTVAMPNLRSEEFFFFILRCKNEIRFQNKFNFHRFKKL